MAGKKEDGVKTKEAFHHSYSPSFPIRQCTYYMRMRAVCMYR